MAGLLAELASMLYWTMLAACTVGPGTVVTCARAGAEFGLSLIWALLVAALIAFTLQEGTARLTIVSGLSLGQCLKTKYSHMTKADGVAAEQARAWVTWPAVPPNRPAGVQHRRHLLAGCRLRHPRQPPL